MPDMPDITPGAVAAIVGALTSILAVILGAPDRLQIPLIITLGALAVAYLAHDAWIRGRRANAMAAVNVAQLNNAVPPPPPPADTKEDTTT